MKKPTVDKKNIRAVFDSKFLKVFGMEYVPGKPYINATRHTLEELPALKSKEDFKTQLPDAVSCVVVLDGPEPKLLLSYEFRYTVGQFMLSVPAGLLDAADKAEAEPIRTAAARELKEEANIDLCEEDRVEIINPLVFSSPGMTDESNALVSVVIADGSRLQLNQDGAEGTECFDGFVFLNREEAMRILKTGRDDNGLFYPLYTWAGLMYFVSDMWKK